ncbi:unnamed protein product [Strongylus vulgaris]|uniref:Neurotransmitter-gated ion-channel ligand-binding domain-containing protein n=1 Tax=Strongylus vulgaris TaxID=40348 RepID=A0A3P7JAX6_STRVU|nr:unnamed protein product [Strongylus vulgaris]
MGSLNEITSDFEIDILFTQLWRDESLSFSHMLACKRNITMEPRLLQRIWTPNTCLINSKRTMIHASPSENVMIILYEVRSYPKFFSAHKALLPELKRKDMRKIIFVLPSLKKCRLTSQTM